MRLQMVMKMKSLPPQIYHSPLDHPAFPFKDIPWLHPYSVSAQKEEDRVVIASDP
jgi:hypothetical protein